IEMGKGPAYIWSSVASTSVPDPLTLVIKTKHVMPIDLVASSQYGAYILSPAAIDNSEAWLVRGNASGTGPYKVRQWDKGQQLVLEKFDEYWGGWSDDQFTRIILRVVSEISTQVQMVRSGEADLLLSTAPADMLGTLEQDSGISVSVFDSWINVPLLLNTKKYPTDNLKFRQALTYLMDYEAIGRDIYGGYGQTPRSCVPQAMWGAGQYELPKLDIAKAKRLLEESGVPKQDWKVVYYAYTGRQEIGQIAELYQALAAQAGVEVDIQQGEWGVLWDKQKQLETSANMFALLWWADWPTPAGWLEPMWKTEDPVVFNFSHYTNAEFDEVLDTGIKLQGSDRAESARKFVEAQAIVLNDAAAMCLADLQKTVVHRSEIKGVAYNAAYETVSIYNLRRVP
ncbi:MAG: ABC transporter substrate-binding protein, partial [Gammaproteobacteria bacterium]